MDSEQKVHSLLDLLDSIQKKHVIVSEVVKSLSGLSGGFLDNELLMVERMIVFELRGSEEPYNDDTDIIPDGFYRYYQNELSRNELINLISK